MNRNILVVASVLLLHALALWALLTGLLRRAVELVVPVQLVTTVLEPPEIEVAPPPIVPAPPPKPVKKPQQPVDPAPASPAPALRPPNQPGRVPRRRLRASNCRRKTRITCEICALAIRP